MDALADPEYATSLCQYRWPCICVTGFAIAHKRGLELRNEQKESEGFHPWDLGHLSKPTTSTLSIKPMRDYVTDYSTYPTAAAESFGNSIIIRPVLKNYTIRRFKQFAFSIQIVFQKTQHLIYLKYTNIQSHQLCQFFQTMDSMLLLPELALSLGLPSHSSAALSKCTSFPILMSVDSSQVMA